MTPDTQRISPALVALAGLLAAPTLSDSLMAQSEGNAAQNPTEELMAPFLDKGQLGRLLVAPKLLALPSEALATRYLPLLTGDRKRLILRVRNLVAGLGDVRYVERERSERALENMGPSISSILETLRKDEKDTEALIRIERILKKLSRMGNEDLQRKALYARGLAEGLEYRAEEAATRALLSSLDHLDGRVRLASIRSLGTHLAEPGMASQLGELAIERLIGNVRSTDTTLRNAVTVAMGTMPLARARAELKKLLQDAQAPLSQRILALRLLGERLDAEAFAALDQSIHQAKGGPNALRILSESHAYLLAKAKGQESVQQGAGEKETGPEEDAPGKAANETANESAEQASNTASGEAGSQSESPSAQEAPAKENPAQEDPAQPSSAQAATVPETASEPVNTRIRLSLLDGGVFESQLLGLRHDRVLVSPSTELAVLGELRLPRAVLDEIQFVGNEPEADSKKPTLIFRSGTRVIVDELQLDKDRIRGKVLGRTLDAPLALLTRLKPSPGSTRAPGGSRKNDQLRLASDGKPIDGKLVGFSADSIRFEPSGAEAYDKSWEDIGSVVLQLRPEDGAQDQGDLGQYVQADLVDGQIVVGMLLDLQPDKLVLATPALGVLQVPSSRLRKLQMANSGRAQAGFTLIADYDTLEVFEIDGEGRRIWELTAVLEPTSAKPTPSGNVLVVEFGDNSVREYDREGMIVWEFPLRVGKLDPKKDISEPWDADRLPNGNTLISDYGNNRVIEVSPKHEIVWEFGAKQAKSSAFAPYNADRLPNGNTLITDYGGSRVIEVDSAGKIIWERKSLAYPWDADRLPNGNTLVVCSKPPRVVEIDPSGQIIWEIDGKNGLVTPTAVERLPDGLTMVCDVQGNGKDEQSGQIRFFDRAGRMVRRIPVEYPTCAKRY
jgi:hypothetical protein